MKGLKLGLLYTVALAVVIWLVFFQLKPPAEPFANLRPANTELTGISVDVPWSAKTGVPANFTVCDFKAASEVSASWKNQGVPVWGKLFAPEKTVDWQQTLTQQVVAADFPVIQFNEMSTAFDDLSVLNKFLTATKGSGEEARRFLLSLSGKTPAKMVALSGWDGFVASLPEAGGFEAAFLAASRFKNQLRGRNLPAWFQIPAKNPATLQLALTAALLHHEITGFQLDLGDSPATTQLMIYLNLLQQLNFIVDFDYVWYTGTQNVGVLTSENRFDTSGLSQAFLTAQTLLRAGMPVEFVPLERFYYTEFLDPYRILFLNYQDQYPASPVFHDNLAQWVRRGGVLIFDPGAPHSGDFWWQQQELDSPAEHLFSALKLKAETAPGIYDYGKGAVIVAENDLAQIREQVQQAVQKINLEYFEFLEQNYLYLKRGPFVIAAVLENSVNNRVLEIPGNSIDCTTPDLPLIDKKILQPGEVALLYNLKKVERLIGKVLISGSLISAEKNENPDFSFTSHGPAGTQSHTLVKLVAMPPKIRMTTAGGQVIPFEMQWVPEQKLLRLIHENQGEAVLVRLTW